MTNATDTRGCGPIAPLRTYKQQVAAERASRKQWLESLIATGLYGTDLARMSGVQVGTFYRMCNRYKVDVKKHKFGGRTRLPDPTKIADKERRKSEEERQRWLARQSEISSAKEKADALKKLARAKADLERQIAPLMREGFTRQQAVRSLANRMGVTG